MKISEYKIVVGATVSEVVEQVNAMLKRGWEPRGSLSSNGKVWAQPMTRWGDED